MVLYRKEVWHIGYHHVYVKNNNQLTVEVGDCSLLRKAFQCPNFTTNGRKVRKTLVLPVQSIKLRQIWLHVCWIFSS